MAEKVLVIEHEASSRQAIVQFLEKEHFDVIFAENGQEGIKKAITEEPSLIICELMMSDINGYQVLDILNQIRLKNLIPFIFITPTNAIDYRRMLSLGADDYLIKPFSDQELLKSIHYSFEKYSLLKAEISHYQEQIKELSFHLRKKSNQAELTAQILEKFLEELRNSITKINLASYLLQRTKEHSKRASYLTITKQESNLQIALLNQISNWQFLLNTNGLTTQDKNNLSWEKWGSKEETH